jgi:hypothetical protein
VINCRISFPDVFLETALVVKDLVTKRLAKVPEHAVVFGPVPGKLYLAVESRPAVRAPKLGLLDVHARCDAATL